MHSRIDLQEMCISNDINMPYFSLGSLLGIYLLCLPYSSYRHSIFFDLMQVLDICIIVHFMALDTKISDARFLG